MDIRDIYVIVGDGFTKGKVVSEIQKEGYKHNFAFGEGVVSADKLKYMKQADEIWVFGKVVGMEEYNIALYHGFDIWVMG